MLPEQPDFAQRILHWFDQHGRHDLPWQHQDDPYAVWVSEIMLQQTQVKTVLPYYGRFMQRFPTVQALATADWDEVATYWQGLGYYARARNLHQAARQLAPRIGQHGWPATLADWIALPGIGRSTAGAILSLGLRQFGVIMDGNVKRVLCRYFAIGDDSTAKPTVDRLWQLATALTPAQRTADYNQAMMDMGATLCTRRKPLCLYCPLNVDCQAFAQGNPEGYPYKPARAAVPEYHFDVWWLDQQGCSLWLRRPASGIWGGLWTLPMTAAAGATTAEDRLPARWYAQSQPVSRLTHGFTHQTWHLSLRRLEQSVWSDLSGIPAGWLADGEWLALPDVTRLALPRPFQTLWQTMTATVNEPES